jgi:hypothetical protein
VTGSIGSPHILQFSGIPIPGSHVLAQGAGELNPMGAFELAKRVSVADIERRERQRRQPDRERPDDRDTRTGGEVQGGGQDRRADDRDKDARDLRCPAPQDEDDGKAGEADGECDRVGFTVAHPG